MIRIENSLNFKGSDPSGSDFSRVSSQEPRRAVHANLPSAASSIPLRKLS